MTPEEQNMRRVPQQGRSQQRVEALLDTAAQLFSEQGYENATTNAIAARAGISIGSLYQYFPNKQAVLRALVGRYVDELRTINSQALQPAPDLPLSQALDAAIDPFIDLEARHPAFMHIALGSDISEEIGAAFAVLDRETLEAITGQLRARAPHLSDARLTLLASVVKAAVKSLFGLMESTPGQQAYHSQAAGEIKRMILLYLAEALGEDAR